MSVNKETEQYLNNLFDKAFHGKDTTKNVATSTIYNLCEEGIEAIMTKGETALNNPQVIVEDDAGLAETTWICPATGETRTFPSYGKENGPGRNGLGRGRGLADGVAPRYGGRMYRNRHPWEYRNR